MKETTIAVVTTVATATFTLRLEAELSSSSGSTVVVVGVGSPPVGASNGSGAGISPPGVGVGGVITGRLLVGVGGAITGGLLVEEESVEGEGSDGVAVTVATGGDSAGGALGFPVPLAVGVLTPPSIGFEGILIDMDMTPPVPINARTSSTSSICTISSKDDDENFDCASTLNKFRFRSVRLLLSFLFLLLLFFLLLRISFRSDALTTSTVVVATNTVHNTIA